MRSDYTIKTMDNIGRILSKRHSNEPEEFELIRTFVQSKFNVTPTLQLHEGRVLIIVGSSALAGSLRLALPELTSQLPASLKIIIRQH